jgi:hypothetical protein
MKRLFSFSGLALVAASLAIFIGCKKDNNSDDDNFVTLQGVYIAGYEKVGEETRAVLWNEGIKQYLSNTISSASSVFVSGNDVYVAGYEGASAVVWKNGVKQELHYGNDTTRAYSVFVFENIVYVAGQAYISSGQQQQGTALLWINGAAQALTDKIYGIASASSVFVSGGHVYAAGVIDPTNNTTNKSYAVLWIDGQTILLSNGRILDRANSVYVAGNDVYVTGWLDSGGVLWKNGEPQSQNAERNFFNNSVYVAGNDVYVAGRHTESLSNGDLFMAATLWKNGVRQVLPHDNNSYHAGSSAECIYVTGSDVYVAGNDHGYGDRSRAMLWKNGEKHRLSDVESYAFSVYCCEN